MVTSRKDWSNTSGYTLPLPSMSTICLIKGWDRSYNKSPGTDNQNRGGGLEPPFFTISGSISEGGLIVRDLRYLRCKSQRETPIFRNANTGFVDNVQLQSRSQLDECVSDWERGVGLSNISSCSFLSDGCELQGGPKKQLVPTLIGDNFLTNTW